MSITLTLNNSTMSKTITASEAVTVCQSPIIPDVYRKVDRDEKGQEKITYPTVDYPSFQKSLGVVDNWSLNSLLKAGINPNMSIHTGNPTRLEGLSSLDKFGEVAEKIISEETNNSEN